MKVLIIGRAVNVWDEVAQAQKMTTFDQTIVVNTSGCHYPGQVDKWVSFHVSLLPEWAKLRSQCLFPPAKEYWSCKSQERLAPRCPLPLHFVDAEGGSSGMTAIMVALRTGGTKVVLAGIPMEQDRGGFDRNGPWFEADRHRVQWAPFLPEMMGRVRSISGWTMQTLGPVTEEWLHAPYSASNNSQSA
jgi:hypothetical protein